MCSHTLYVSYSSVQMEITGTLDRWVGVGKEQYILLCTQPTQESTFNNPCKDKWLVGFLNYLTLVGDHIPNEALNLARPRCSVPG